MLQDLKISNSSLFDIEQDLASTRADIATNKHLKDEVSAVRVIGFLIHEFVDHWSTLSENVAW